MRETPGMSKLPRWVEVWGPVIVILGAMWTMMNRLEDRLTVRIVAVEERVVAVEERARGVESKVDQLTGLVRGLHRMDPTEDR